MSHEEIRPKQGEIIIPQFGGQKKPAGKGKKSALTPSQLRKTMTQEDKAPVREQVQQILDQIAEPVAVTQSADVQPIVPPVEPVTPVEPEFPTTVDQTLVKILQWKRPGKSAGETHFVAWLHKEIQRRGAKYEVTAGGNIVVKINYPTKPGEKPPAAPTVLFSCHTDTVHHECNGTQVVMYDKTLGQLFLSNKKEDNPGSCLGADDGAGVWLCLEMIKAGVPGSYVFHREEETGGVGGRALLADNQSWIEQHDIAIAFDRKDTVDVVITQGGQACASGKLGAALAAALNAGDTTFEYKISHGGTFTDTKTYRNHIAECVNISVGYENAHSPAEYLNYGHLIRLRHVLINLKWDSLPVDRDPKTAEVYSYKQGGGYNGRGVPGYENYKGKGFAGYPVSVDDDFGLLDMHLEAKAAARRDAEKKLAEVVTPPAPKERAIVSLARSNMEPAILDEMRQMTLDDIRDLSEDPDASFSVLVAMFTELEAAYVKVETYRSLAEMD